MRITEYFSSENQNHWLEKIKECDKESGQYLYGLLKDNRLKELYGPKASVFLLTENDELISFCTLVQADGIQSGKLTPRIELIYTFPEYRGHHYSELLIKKAEKSALESGMTNIYISTNETGLYEKFGYEFYELQNDIIGNSSCVYKKSLDLPKNPHCPCKRKKCPRHGSCNACIEHHTKINRKLPCKRKDG